MFLLSKQFNNSNKNFTKSHNNLVFKIKIQIILFLKAQLKPLKKKQIIIKCVFKTVQVNVMIKTQLIT